MKYVTVFLLFIPTIILCSENVLTTDQALQDAYFTFQKMKEIHPNIFFSLDKQGAEMAFSELIQVIQFRKSWHLRDFFRYLAEFVAKFKDGHTYLSITDQFSEYLESGGKVVPLFVSFSDSFITILESIPSGMIEPGSKLVSLNNLTADTLRNEIMKMISFEREPFAYSKASSLFHLYMWVIFGSQDVFTVEVVTPLGKHQIVELSSVSFDLYKQRRSEIQAFSFDKLWDFSFLSEGVALLTLNTFSSKYKKDLEIFIRDCFQQIRSRGVKTLVIDIRKNGGGDSSIAEYLYSFISDKPYRTYAEVHVKYSEDVLKKINIYDPILLFRVKILGQKTIVNKNNFKSPRRNSLRFNGDVYVLVGPQTFSAATDFAAIIKDLSIGKIVGQETGGLASCYGDVFSLTLPNSKLKLGVSFKYFLRCGGFNDKRGVIPDVVVEADSVLESKGVDPVINAVLEDIKNGDPTGTELESFK